MSATSILNFLKLTNNHQFPNLKGKLIPLILFVCVELDLRFHEHQNPRMLIYDV